MDRDTAIAITLFYGLPLLFRCGSGNNSECGSLHDIGEAVVATVVCGGIFAIYCAISDWRHDRKFNK